MSEVYRFIAAEKAAYLVALLCRVLDVARSSFYAWSAAEQTRQTRMRADNALVHEIRNPSGLQGSLRCRRRVR